MIVTIETKVIPKHQHFRFDDEKIITINSSCTYQKFKNKIIKLILLYKKIGKYILVFLQTYLIK